MNPRLLHHAASIQGCVCPTPGQPGWGHLHTARAPLSRRSHHKSLVSELRSEVLQAWAGEGWGSQDEGDTGPRGVTGRAPAPRLTHHRSPRDRYTVRSASCTRNRENRLPQRRSGLLFSSQHHGTGPSCPHAGVRACPLALCGSRCRGNPTCLPSTSQRRREVNRPTKGLHCPHGPHCAPHGAWLSAPRPERHPPGWAGGRSRWSCGNTGPGLLRVWDGGPWNWGSSGSKHDACLLSRKIGTGAGWSYRVRGNRGRPAGPPAQARGLDPRF